MWRYIRCLARVSFIMAALVSGFGVLTGILALFIPMQPGGWQLLLMCLGFALAVFAVCMLPAIRFWWMIRRQEKAGLPFPTEEPQLISRDWTGTYLAGDWLICAGIHALHVSRIAAIHGKRVNPGRSAPGHLIIVKITGGRTCRWHLSQRNTKVIRDWFNARKSGS